ncbi:MAG TPA: MBG domain-containing protein [Candidatus Limnocylindrales bacterium]|nr:MBG domain-containing protein [Candidatus Limnocylindrales bacterium]
MASAVTGVLPARAAGPATYILVVPTDASGEVTGGAGGDAFVLDQASYQHPTGEPQAFAVYAFDASNVFLGDVTSSSTISMGAGGTCNGNQCSADAAGRYTITATYNGLSAGSQLVVTHCALSGTATGVTACSGNGLVDPRHVIVTNTAQNPFNFQLVYNDIYGDRLNGNYNLQPVVCSSGSGTGHMSSVFGTATAMASVQSVAANGSFLGLCLFEVTFYGSRQSSSLAVLAGLAPGALTLLGQAGSFAKPGQCVRPPALNLSVPEGAIAAVDTNQGCDETNGGASNPLTGFIRLNPGRTTPLNVNLNVIALPSGASLQGSLAIAFGACLGGTATDGQLVPGNPPVYPTVTAASATGVVDCYYALTYTGDLPLATTSMMLVTQLFDNSFTMVGASGVSITFNPWAPPSLDHLVVSPVQSTVAPGVSVTYRADGFDAAGHGLGDLTRSAAFSIAPDGVCVLQRCSATQPGTHTVTATLGGKTGTATMDVQVVQVAQTISFTSPAPSPALFGGSYTPTALATSGLPVTLSLDASSAGCTLASGVVSLAGLGTCVIDANQAGDASYLAAPQVQQSFAIQPFPIATTVTGSQDFGSQSPVFNHAEAPPAGITLSGTVACTTVDSGAAIGPSLAAGAHVIDGASCSGLAPSDPTNYTIAYTGGAFTVIQPKTGTTITGVSGAATYGGAATLTATLRDAAGIPVAGASISFKLGGLPAGIQTTDANGVATLTGVALLPAETNAGLYGGAVEADFTGDSRLLASTAVGDLNVAQAQLSVTADPQSKVYGDPNPAFIVSYSGFVNGDTPASLGGALSFTTAATTSSPVGSYAINPTGLTSSNYAISFVPGALTVNPAQLTVKADDKTRSYGAPNPTFTATITGFKNGETLATSGVTGTPSCDSAATAASPVSGSPYAITCNAGSLAATNYTFTFQSGQLAVLKADQSIAFAPIPSPSPGGGAVTLTATATSGLTVLFSASGRCTVSGSSLTIIGGGLCAVTATQPGDANYNAATPVTQTVGVGCLPSQMSFSMRGWRGGEFVVFQLTLIGQQPAADGGGCTASFNVTMHGTLVATGTLTATTSGTVTTAALSGVWMFGDDTSPLTATLSLDFATQSGSLVYVSTSDEETRTTTITFALDAIGNYLITGVTETDEPTVGGGDDSGGGGGSDDLAGVSA